VISALEEKGEKCAKIGEITSNKGISLIP